MKRLLAAAFAALSIAVPVEARIDPYTDELVSAMKSDGIEVAINSKRCEMSDIHGSFAFRPRTGWRLLTLCPGETFDALAHSTVRHEAYHAIQLCVNTRRGTSFTTPILTDGELRRFLHNHLHPDTMASIQAVYPEEHWLIEYEAFAAEEAFTALEILDMYEQACDGLFEERPGIGKMAAY